MSTLQKTDMKWYVVRAQNTREKGVAEKILKEGEKGILEGKIGQVLVPIEKTITVKSGKKVEKESIMLPGYIFVETSAVGEVKYFLRSLKGTSGFLTERNGDIKSLTQIEVNKMIGKHQESQDRTIDATFVVGEEVTIIDGPFTSMKASIENITDKKVTLSVSIFGRKTPLTLELHQIDKR